MGVVRTSKEDGMTFNGYAVVYYLGRYRIAPTVASCNLDRFTMIVERHGGRVVSVTPIKYKETTRS